MSEHFSDSYADARARFQSAASAVGARVATHTIAARGPAGENLSIDTAQLGAERPHTVVLITSGVHGLEGYTGSALQTLWLTEFARALPAGVAVLLVHAVNPFGFAHGRRMNENNVDLNRNALAQFPGAANPGYRRLNAWLNPSSPVPAIDHFILRGAWYRFRDGIAALQQAVAGGQYEFPHGLFYGGRDVEESTRLIAHIVDDATARAAQTVLHLDLHTGLGASGTYQILLDVPTKSPTFARFQRWFDTQHVVSDHADDAANYVAYGMLTQLIERKYASQNIYTAVVEFGTHPATRVLKALRAENRLYHHGCGSARRAQRVRAELREMFYPADPQWRAAIISHGRTIFTQLQRALSDGLS